MIRDSLEKLEVTAKVLAESSLAVVDRQAEPCGLVQVVQGFCDLNWS